MPTSIMRGRSQRAEQPPKFAPPEGLAPAAAPPTAPPAPTDELDKFLYTSDRPNEPITAGASSGRAAPPAVLHAMLPKLLKAAQEPGAPPELHMFIRNIRALLGE